MMLFGFAGIAAIVGLILPLLFWCPWPCSPERGADAMSTLFLLGIAGAVLLVILLTAALTRR